MTLETEVKVGARADFEDTAQAIEQLVRGAIDDFKRLGIESAQAARGPEAFRQTVEETRRSVAQQQATTLSFIRTLGEEKRATTDATSATKQGASAWDNYTSSLGDAKAAADQQIVAQASLVGLQRQLAVAQEVVAAARRQESSGLAALYQQLGEARGATQGMMRDQQALAAAYRTQAAARGQTLTMMQQEAAAARGLGAQLADLAAKARASAGAGINNLLGPGGAAGFLRTAGATAVGFGTVQLAAQIGSAIPDNLKKWSDAAVEAQNADARLRVALRLTNQETGENVEVLQRQAKELERVIGIEDERIMGVQALALTLGRAGIPEAQRMTKAAADLAAALGTDLESAMLMITKASEGQAVALNRLGFHFEATGDKAADTEAVLRLVETRLNGMASGALGEAQRRINELQAGIHDNDEVLGDWSKGMGVAQLSLRKFASDMLVLQERYGGILPLMKTFREELEGANRAGSNAPDWMKSAGGPGALLPGPNSGREYDLGGDSDNTTGRMLRGLEGGLGRDNPLEDWKRRTGRRDEFEEDIAWGDVSNPKGSGTGFDLLDRGGADREKALKGVKERADFLKEFDRLLGGLGFSAGKAGSADELPPWLRGRFDDARRADSQIHERAPFDTSGREDSPFQQAQKDMEALGMSVEKVGDQSGPAAKALAQIARENEKVSKSEELRLKNLQRLERAGDQVGNIIQGQIDAILFEHQTLWQGIRGIAVGAFRTIVNELIEEATRAAGHSLVKSVFGAILGAATGGASVPFTDSPIGGGGLNLGSARGSTSPSSSPNVNVTIVAVGQQGGGRPSAADLDFVQRYGGGRRVYDPDLENFVHERILPIVARAMDPA